MLVPESLAVQRARWAGLVLALVALLGLNACKKGDEKTETGQKEERQGEVEATVPGKSDLAGEHIDNTSYRFRISQSGPDWKLLDRDDARQIASDAQAALTSASGLSAVVIVEYVPGMQLEQMTKLILDAMPIEDKSVTRRDDQRFVGLPAVQFEISGKVNEVPMAYRGRIFMRGNYSYQLVAFAAAGQASEQDWQQAFSSFTLTEGEIAPEAQQGNSPDMLGVGWQLKEGVFQSAISGLKVAPKSGWRAVVGAEARRMNADAEVVLVRQAPDAYLLVIPERIGKSSRASYLQSRVDATAANLEGTTKRSKVESTFLGQDVTSTVLTGSEMPWTFQVNVGFHEGWAVQATGWYTAGIGQAGSEAIAEAMKSVSMMSRAETAALSSRLLVLPDEQDAVGAQHSLRSGIFRDYEHGVVWSKPKGFWELSVGQEARAINPVAQLYGRYNNSALHFMIVAENAPGVLNEKIYHQNSVAGVLTNPDISTMGNMRATKIATGPALVTDAKTDKAGVSMAYRVVTAAMGTRGVQLHIWGEVSSMLANAAAADQVIRNLQLQSHLPANEMQKGVYLDHRLGFSMKLDPEYAYHDTTPPEIQGIGSYPTWGQDGADWVGVLAIRAIEAGRDREWSMNTMEDRISESFTKLVKGAPGKREETTLVGLPARHLSWTTGSRRLDAYLIRRHQTIYALAATDADGGTEMIEKAMAGFSLIN